MARTRKKKPYHPYRKENKAARHNTHVKYRMAVKTRMAANNYDGVPPKVQKTSGWQTW